MACVVLVGGTALFAYYSLNQFNNALDNLSASCFVIANMSSISFSDKTDKEQIPTTTTIPEITLVPTTPIDAAIANDLEPSFIFPKKNDEVYIGCTYQISFQSSTTTDSLATALIDAGARETIEPIASGLASENKIEPNSQNFNWKVGIVWPGKYYIKASNINNSDLESDVFRSDVFTIRNMPKDISADEREKICKESEGLF